MKTGTYRGRKYRVLFIGKTQFGQRAHLQYFDGSKDFWVGADAVSDISNENQPSPTKNARRTRKLCELCGVRAPMPGGGNWCSDCA